MLWRIELLGWLRATRGDRVITRFRTQKTGGLLAYLAYYFDRSHPREQLMELLWPEHRLDAARTSLSVALSSLRRQLERDDAPSSAAPGRGTGSDAAPVSSSLILADHSTVRLNPSLVTTDVAAFEAALEAATQAGETSERAKWLSRAVEVYHGELLPGYYEDWILQERQWLTERYFGALGQLLQHLESEGEYQRALQFAQRGVRVDPLREEAHRDLIRLYAAAGQPAAGLRQYQELERLLKEQLGAVPSGESRELARELERLIAVAGDPASVAREDRLIRTDSRSSPASSPDRPPQRVALLYKNNSQPDEQLLGLLEARLTARGHQVFVDRHPAIGIEWAREIERAVRNADAVVPLLSPASAGSGMLAHLVQMANEAAQEQEGRPRLLPVRITYTGPLPESLASVLDSVESIVWRGPEDDERVVRELLRALLHPGLSLRGLGGPAAGEVMHPERSRAAAERAEPSQVVRTVGPEGPSGAVPRADPLLGRGTASPPETPPLPGEDLPSRDTSSISSPAGGVVPLGSPYYVVRAIDAQFHLAIARQDSIVLVKGARQTGKTSLLARGLQRARDSGARVVLTDLQMLDLEDLASVERLFRTLAEWIADQVELDIFPDQVWKAHLGTSVNFERYLRREVLGKVEQPIVWGLDEVDRLFPYDYSSQVFGLFRSWHNRRGLDPTGPWSRLTLAMAYATEAHLFITDVNQSPFNVGTRLALEDFMIEQVADLNQRYGSPLRYEVEVERFHSLLGGHPYLVSRGLQEMAAGGLGFAAFAAQADHDEGIFGDHLRQLLVLLARDAEMCEVMRAVLRGCPCPTRESFYRLRSAGVLAGSSAQDARPRCPVYATYLQRHLR